MKGIGPFSLFGSRLDSGASFDVSPAKDPQALHSRAFSKA